MLDSRHIGYIIGLLAWLLNLGIEMGVKVEGGTHEHVSRIFALDNRRSGSVVARHFLA